MTEELELPQVRRWFGDGVGCDIHTGSREETSQSLAFWEWSL